MAVADFSRLFSPRSIAVVGASADTAKLGGQVVARLAATFDGALFPVNPAHRQIAGRAAIPSLADLPQPVDLAVALAPGAALVDELERCPAGRLAFVAAIPSGFGEIGGDGPALQARLAAAARAIGARLVGPNSVGLFNGTTRLNASIIPLLTPARSRGLGLVTQSGGFGMAAAMYAADNGLPVARFCDVGNSADIGAAELLDHLTQDEDTAVIGAYIESARDPAAFAAALARANERKPTLLCLLGKSAAGRRASQAHLGIAPAPAALRVALPRSVLEVDTGLDLLHAAKALLSAPPVTGNRLAVVTGTGGIGTELSDLASERGLVVPAFSAPLARTLAARLPPYAATGNPVDLTPVWRDYPRLYPAILADIAASGEADMAIVSITDVPTTVPDLAAALARSAPQLRRLPLIAYWGSRDCDLAAMSTLQTAGIPCYRSTRETVDAAAVIWRGARASRGD